MARFATSVAVAVVLLISFGLRQLSFLVSSSSFISLLDVGDECVALELVCHIGPLLLQGEFGSVHFEVQQLPDDLPLVLQHDVVEPLHHLKL